MGERGGICVDRSCHVHVIIPFVCVCVCLCYCRPTLFLEIIQRVGCLEDSPDGKGKVQRGGCGGFGKGNFHALFRSIEEYEKKLNLN